MNIVSLFTHPSAVRISFSCGIDYKSESRPLLINLLDPLTFQGLFLAVQALLCSLQFLNRYFVRVLTAAAWQCPTLPVQVKQTQQTTEQFS